MACGLRSSTAFLTWGHGDGPKRGYSNGIKLKPAVTRIGVKTGWAHSPGFIAANIRKFETKEKRERELIEWEDEIIRQRREQQMKELLSPIQLEAYGHRASSQSRKELSTSPLSVSWRASPKEARHEAEDLKEGEKGSISSSRSLTLTHQTSDDSYSFVELEQFTISTRGKPDDNSVKNGHSQQEIKQYLALMSAARGTSTNPTKRIEPEKELYVGPLRDALNRLKQSPGSRIPPPDDECYEDCFNINLPWMTIDIKELITMPDCLISSDSVSDVERSYSAALLRQAAWDHYFFEKKGPAGTFSVPFCDSGEGDTPADQFFYPSQEVRDLTTNACLWEQISDKKVLEHFMKFFIRGKHMNIPPNWIKSGFIEKVHQAMNDSEMNLNAARKKFDEAFDDFVRCRKSAAKEKQKKTSVCPVVSSSSVLRG